MVPKDSIFYPCRRDLRVIGADTDKHRDKRLCSAPLFSRHRWLRWWGFVPTDYSPTWLAGITVKADIYGGTGYIFIMGNHMY